MDGIAALAWPSRTEDPPTAEDMTPRRENDKDIGELASDLAANIAGQREAHDRLRKSLDATDAKVEAVLGMLRILQTDFAAWKATPPQAAKLQFTSGMVYSIFVTGLLFAGTLYGFYQATDAKAQTSATAVHDIQVQMAAQKNVEAAEQRLRDFKEATQAAAVEDAKRLSQLNAAYITSLQRDQRK